MREKRRDAPCGVSILLFLTANAENAAAHTYISKQGQEQVVCVHSGFASLQRKADQFSPRYLNQHQPPRAERLMKSRFFPTTSLLPRRVSICLLLNVRIYFKHTHTLSWCCDRLCGSAFRAYI